MVFEAFELQSEGNVGDVTENLNPPYKGVPVLDDVGDNTGETDDVGDDTNTDTDADTEAFEDTGTEDVTYETEELGVTQIGQNKSISQFNNLKNSFSVLFQGTDFIISEAEVIGKINNIISERGLDKIVFEQVINEIRNKNKEMGLSELTQLKVGDKRLNRYKGFYDVAPFLSKLSRVRSANGNYKQIQKYIDRILNKDAVSYVKEERQKFGIMSDVLSNNINGIVKRLNTGDLQIGGIIQYANLLTSYGKKEQLQTLAKQLKTYISMIDPMSIGNNKDSKLKGISLDDLLYNILPNVDNPSKLKEVLVEMGVKDGKLIKGYTKQLMKQKDILLKYRNIYNTIKDLYKKSNLNWATKRSRIIIVK